MNFSLTDKTLLEVLLTYSLAFRKLDYVIPLMGSLLTLIACSLIFHGPMLTCIIMHNSISVSLILVKIVPREGSPDTFLY